MFITLFLNGLFSNGQEKDSSIYLNHLFRLNVDSLESRSFIYDSDTSISHYIYYSITNLSTDTLTVVTNSCPSYNEYTLQIGNRTFITNSDVHCIANFETDHKLGPNETFQNVEIIYGVELKDIKAEKESYTITVFLQERIKNKFHVTPMRWGDILPSITSSGVIKLLSTEDLEYSRRYKMKIKKSQSS